MNYEHPCPFIFMLCVAWRVYAVARAVGITVLRANLNEVGFLPARLFSRLFCDFPLSYSYGRQLTSAEEFKICLFVVNLVCGSAGSWHYCAERKPKRVLKNSKFVCLLQNIF